MFHQNANYEIRHTEIKIPDKWRDSNPGVEWLKARTELLRVESVFRFELRYHLSAGIVTTTGQKVRWNNIWRPGPQPL
jgi:hypothetical protein